MLYSYNHTQDDKNMVLLFFVRSNWPPSPICIPEERSIDTLLSLCCMGNNLRGGWSHVQGSSEQLFFAFIRYPQPIEPEGSEVCPRSPTRQSRLRPARLRTRTRSVEMNVSNCFEISSWSSTQYCDWTTRRKLTSLELECKNRMFLCVWMHTKPPVSLCRISMNSFSNARMYFSPHVAKAFGEPSHRIFQSPRAREPFLLT